jgi:RNA polymerase sigma-70 factor, ECF subfamily
MNQNDEQLILDYLNGDDSAFEELLKRYLKPIYNFLYQLTGNTAQAEDLTQETFVKAWKNIRKFDKAKSFKTWIFTIAKNTAFDYFKKKKTIPFSYFEDLEGNNKLEEISEEAVLLDEIMERRDLAEKLESMLRKIPEQYSIILRLHYKEDFSLGEIAEILGKPYNTIKTYHQRALTRLKKVLLEG